MLAVLRCASAAGKSPAVQARSVPALRRPRGREGRGRPAGGEHHDPPAAHRRPRTRAREEPDRPPPRRTPALRPPPVRGRTRPEAAARGSLGPRRRRRHLRRLHLRLPRHPPRTRPGRPALGHRQRPPPRHRPGRTRARRQRTGTAAQPARAGRVRGEVGRIGAAPGRRPDADRTPQRTRGSARSRLRRLRPPLRQIVAAALRLAGQPARPSPRR